MMPGRAMNRIDATGYELVRPDLGQVRALYAWKASEPRRDHFTCRPVKPLNGFEEYYDKLSSWLREPMNLLLALVAEGTTEPLGEVRGFDWNERNRSLEFGYYLPPDKRGRGYGKAMARLFVERVFGDAEAGVNKVYATTSAENAPSIRTLEGLGFRLDGRNREHYWIDGRRYDQCVYSLLASEWRAPDAAKP